ncbi:MAG TPA: ethanolamine utilization protein EutN [Rhodobacteraceae bacterium]|nr:EutN/CcmL family microcompartment protein [Amylibacter sp.]MDG1235736.1 EutN/CcmL family microcompartment protein [Amylibacter sp.]MDG1998710.1 EutN/CcmL family microcompartment protein [Amylibacter sp.]HAD28164.1 ethanolamine utilization protein EutN [Paracoccaceae bacterium]|tara:strand:- start:618 stop:887 length:270 start_codon:yes stop_codon:yes gene_type:complete
MKLARVVGTVTATAKDTQLVGATLLLCDITDGVGGVLSEAQVATDTVGAGVGDTVLITTGSAARMAAGSAGSPVDATIVAVVDKVALAK